MSNETAVHRFELRVVFEEDDNSVVSWSVHADESIEQTINISCEELTEAGAPLSALGIKVLHRLLACEIIDLALNKADNYRWRNLFQRLMTERQVKSSTAGRPDLQIVH